MLGMLRSRLRKVGGWTLGLLSVGLAAAALPATAAAATPIALDVPNNGSAPYIAFDPISKYTFVAWTDPQTTTNGGIDMCVLPPSTTTCEGGGPVLLTVSTVENPAIAGDNTISLGGLTILPNGDVVVIATPVSTGSIAFESPGDGSAFLTSGQGLQNTGDFISPVSLFYTGNNVAPLGNTDVALLDDYANYFSDSPFAGPEFPSKAQLPASNSNPGGLYPRKSLFTDGPEVASEPAPAPAAAGTDIVVGVGDNQAGPNTQLSDCVNGDNVGTGYGVDVGKVGASNAAGYLNYQNGGASIPAYSGLACNAQNPVVASPEGGPQGIGVLENEGDGLDGGSTYTLDYRPFIVNSAATGGSFGSPVLISKLTDYAEDIDVVDDSGDGVYAFWSGGDNFNVNYSLNGGTTWGSPAVIPTPSNVSYSDPVITAVAGGVFLLAFDANTGSGKQTFIESLSYPALATPVVASASSSATTTGSTVTVTITCPAACSVTITLEAPGGSASAARAADKKKARKPVKLGTGTLNLSKAGAGKLVVKLNGKGKSLFRKDHDKLKTTALLSTKTAQGTAASSKTLKITKGKGKGKH